MPNNMTYGEAVSNLQRYLRRIELEDNYSSGVPVDGIYGSATRSAVSTFQRRNDLPTTGIVNKETWDAIYLRYEALIRQKDTRIYPDPFPRSPKNYATELGEQSAFVSILQFILDELRTSYDTLPSFVSNGIFNEDTSLAVKELQRIHSLPITGRVDLNTWNAIVDAYNRYATVSQ